MHIHDVAISRIADVLQESLSDLGYHIRISIEERICYRCEEFKYFRCFYPDIVVYLERNGMKIALAIEIKYLRPMSHHVILEGALQVARYINALNDHGYKACGLLILIVDKIYMSSLIQIAATEIRRLFMTPIEVITLYSNEVENKESLKQKLKSVIVRLVKECM